MLQLLKCYWVEKEHGSGLKIEQCLMIDAHKKSNSRRRGEQEDTSTQMRLAQR